MVDEVAASVVTNHCHLKKYYNDFNVLFTGVTKSVCVHYVVPRRLEISYD